MELVIVGVAGAGLGWVASWFLVARPLVRTITEMRREGFLPVFDIEQRTERDPSAEIREY